MQNHIKQVARLLAMAPKRNPKPVHIRIPADHPRVDKLVQIFTCLSTGAKFPSGIVITGGGVSDEAMRIFLNELDTFLAEDGIDFGLVMAPFLEDRRNDLSLEVVMKVVAGALNEAPSPSRIPNAGLGSRS